MGPQQAEVQLNVTVDDDSGHVAITNSRLVEM